MRLPDEGWEFSDEGWNEFNDLVIPGANHLIPSQTLARDLAETGDTRRKAKQFWNNETEEKKVGCGMYK